MNKYTHEVIVGVFVIFGLICLGYMTINFGKVALFGDESYSLYAEFSSVTGLRAGNPVEIMGMQVGRVESFEMDQNRQVALVKLKIDKDVKVFGDAVAAIKTAGLIGDRYLSIDPGGSMDPLQPGQTILDTQPPVDIGDLIGRFAFGQVKKEDQQVKE